MAGTIKQRYNKFMTNKDVERLNINLRCASQTIQFFVHLHHSSLTKHEVPKSSIKHVDVALILCYTWILQFLLDSIVSTIENMFKIYMQLMTVTMHVWYMISHWQLLKLPSPPSVREQASISIVVDWYAQQKIDTITHYKLLLILQK